MIAIRPLLQLGRISNVFTAFADILAGFALFGGSPIPWSRLGLLMGASGCLYTAGMVLNDVCDAQQDLAERPSRPIPSGRVSLRFATVLAACLLVVGWLLGCAVGSHSGQLAAGIVVGVMLYDGLLKKTPLGPMLMGACRALNLLLGMSAADTFATSTQTGADPRLFVAIAMWLYITGLTWFARREAAQSTRPQLAAALITLNMGLLVALAILLPNRPHGMNALIPIAYITLTVNRPAVAALRSLSPVDVQQTIRVGILNIIVFDTAIAAAAQGWSWALVIPALLVPTIVLGRWVPHT